MRKLFYQLPFFILLAAAVISCGEEKPRDFSDVKTDEHKPASIFDLYQDSLNKYFGPLEQDLLRKYKENHNKMDTQEDFYSFYRNTHILKSNLKKTLQSHITELKDQGVMDSDIPEFSWFKVVAEGLEVGDIQGHTQADIFYDYNILLKYAQKTEGTADDEYTKLIRVCFEDDKYYPVWVKSYKENEDSGCSLLGDGKHFIAMEQILKAQAAGDLFDREIAKVKSLIYKDIFFKKEYCLQPEEAIEELQLIKDKLDLKDSDKRLFEARIQQFKDAEKYKLQFNCQSGDCVHESKSDVKPDV